MTRAGASSPSSLKAARAALQDRLGYRFRKKALLDEALTHSSLESLKPGRRHNQRLEFLGDRVLGLVVADSLFGRLADEREGLLTDRYQRCVKNSTLARVARDLGVGEALEAQPKSRTDKMLADALEAIFGAVWRDGGIEAVRPAIVGVLGDVIEDDEKPKPKPKASGRKGGGVAKAGRPGGKAGKDAAAGAGPRKKGGARKDGKTRLQEYAQKRKIALPAYELVDQKGPDHAPEFKVSVSLGSGKAEASGPSKQQAEQNAAAILLGKLP